MTFRLNDQQLAVSEGGTRIYCTYCEVDTLDTPSPAFVRSVRPWRRPIENLAFSVVPRETAHHALSKHGCQQYIARRAGGMFCRYVAFLEQCVAVGENASCRHCNAAKSVLE